MVVILWYGDDNNTAIIEHLLFTAMFQYCVKYFLSFQPLYQSHDIRTIFIYFRV